MTTPKLFQAPRSMPQRFVRWWRRVFFPGDIVSLLIVTVMLLASAYSLQAAGWPLLMNTVTPALVFSVLFGFTLARSRYDELFSLLISTLYGILAVFMIAAINEPGGILDGSTSVISRVMLWVYDAATGGINSDNLVFTLLVASLFWYLGYNASWHIFRLDRVWRVILPPALIMLTNIVVYNGSATLDIYLLVFLFMALLLLVRSHMDAREWDWYINGVRGPVGLRNQFLRAGAVLALVALLIAWAVPRNDVQERLDNFQRFLNSDPIRQLSEMWNRLFEPVETQGPATADYYGSDSLSLGGSIRLGEQTVFYVEAPQDRRYYWRSRVFERYDNGRWQPAAEYRVVDRTAPLDINWDQEVMGAARQRIAQTFTVAMSGTRLIYAAPQPASVSVAGQTDIRRTLPMLEAESPMNVSVIRPLNVLSRGTEYTVESLVSTATAFELRAAGTDYPDWVRDPNAVAGFSVGFRTAELARSIVANAGATNPYDQAKAIETWLRTNIRYSETIPAPPDGVDPVEWLLFDRREGYCTYYATAMISMLRSLGVPARMAAGFSQGEYDATLGEYIVRERDAHTWVEVYFPGYGWVEFEPTANQDPLTRDGDQSIAPAQRIAQPTPLPSNTPTPVPSPTPLPTNTPQPDDPQQTPEAAPPTITPTPSQTPTATPVIVPTVPPDMQVQPPNDVFSALLRAFGAAFLLLLLVIAFVLLLVFVWWWWEWRGLGKLTPISRAYARLERFLPLAGVRTADQQTTEERRQYVVRQIPQAERPITTIMRLYTRERYGRQRGVSPADSNEASRVDEAWPLVRKTILGRWLRRLLPGGRRRE